jgi:hypothetical protein
MRRSCAALAVSSAWPNMESLCLVMIQIIHCSDQHYWSRLRSSVASDTGRTQPLSHCWDSNTITGGEFPCRAAPHRARSLLQRAPQARCRGRSRTKPERLGSGRSAYRQCRLCPAGTVSSAGGRALAGPLRRPHRPPAQPGGAAALGGGPGGDRDRCGAPAGHWESAGSPTRARCSSRAPTAEPNGPRRTAAARRAGSRRAPSPSGRGLRAAVGAHRPSAIAFGPLPRAPVGCSHGDEEGGGGWSF